MSASQTLDSAPRPGLRDRFRLWRDRTVADPAFRAWAARFPLTRPIARRRAGALFDLCAGFAYAQVLDACVTLGVFELLAPGPLPAAAFAARLGLPPDRARALIDAAAGLDLLVRRDNGVALGPLGAAMVGNPAVAAMVRHHRLLYRDLADPVALLRGETAQTNLAAYWPYGTASDPGTLSGAAVADYSALMAASQPLVAAEILAAYDVRCHRVLMDVGGGEGAFLRAAAQHAPGLALRLFDLPEVVARADPAIQRFGGDMRRDELPPGADLLSLVRVIHDHDDAPAMAILRAARAALAPGGTLLLAEPMLGVPGAERVGAYFAIYLLALGSGRPRTRATLIAMLHDAGFARVRARRTGNPLLTSLLVANPT